MQSLDERFIRDGLLDTEFHAADHVRRLSRLLRHNARFALLDAPPDRRRTGLNQSGFRTPAFGRHDG